jgi:hypothetical protein
MAMAAEPAQRTGIGQQALLAAVQGGALAQVADIVERAPRTFAHDGLHGRFIAAVDQAQAEPDRRRPLLKSSVQSQSLWRTSTGSTPMPCRRASCSSWSGL